MSEPIRADRPSGYGLLRAANGRGATITVPRHFADLIPEDTIFDVEMNDDGLLYRARTEGQGPQIDPLDLPAWVQDRSI